MAGRDGGHRALDSARVGRPRAWPARSQVALGRLCGLRRAPGIPRKETALREEAGESCNWEGTGVQLPSQEAQALF